MVAITVWIRDDIFTDIMSTGNVHCGIFILSRRAGLPHLCYDSVVNGILDENKILKRADAGQLCILG